MLMVREVFNCKPGKANELLEKMKKGTAAMGNSDTMRNQRIMVDAVTDYWTVVMQYEVESLAALEQSMRESGNRPEVREALAGYMDLVNGGRREIYRIV